MGPGYNLSKRGSGERDQSLSPYGDRTVHVETGVDLMPSLEKVVLGSRGATDYVFAQLKINSGTARKMIIGHFCLFLILSCSQSPMASDRSIESGATPLALSDTLIDVSFEKYSTTEELRADRVVFAVENLSLDHVFLDAEVAFRKEGLTKSMRYDWVDQGTNSVSIGRGIKLPTQVAELWVEIAVRYSENFTPCNPRQPPCAHKTFFLQVVPDRNYRWGMIIGAGGAAGPNAPFTFEAPRIGSNMGSVSSGTFWEKNHGLATDFMDGRWWLLRWHVRHSSDPSEADGMYEFWMIDENGHVADRYSSWESGERFSTAENTRIGAILLGRNKDKGLDQGTESMWIGRVRAYAKNPGW